MPHWAIAKKPEEELFRELFVQLLFSYESPPRRGWQQKKREKGHNFLPSHHRRNQFATTQLFQDCVHPSQKFYGQNESGLTPYHMRNLNRTIKEN
jgi:hypothetical protein